MKYIVYITTNIVNKKIYVGVHKTETPYDFDGYLGNGVKVTDRYTYKFSKTPFEAAVNKYGPDKFIRKTLYVFNTLEEALEKEVEIVNAEFISRKDTYNITLGGNLPPIKVKTIYQYSLDGEFIKEWPSITEASLKYKCSTSCIGKAVFDRTPSLGYLWTDFKYDSINIEEFKINANKTKCYLYDVDGEYLQEFKSITDCAKFINVSVPNLSTAIKGKYKVSEYYVSDKKLDFFEIESNKYADGFYQYDLDGVFIKHIKNLSELKNATGVNNPSAVYRALRTNNSAYGFQWSGTFVPNMKKLVTKTQARKVGKYTLDGELVKVFNTVREAKADTCGAPNVLIGKRKTAGGHVFRYIEE